MPEIEDNWDDLLALIEERQVIPIVGAELREIVENGIPVGLYATVAARLLRRYGLTPVPADASPAGDERCVALRTGHELNDAVCGLARVGRRVQDLYRPVNDELRAVLAGQPVPTALRQLASITHFDLFVSTTCDDLLGRAIDDQRFGGAAGAERIEFAPNLSSDKARDLRPSGREGAGAAVFHVFGRASASPQFAIHDEDTLEFVHTLQEGRGPERLLGALKSRNLLLVGCNFSDWLSRFFIRLANQARLSDNRAKKEFLADRAAAADGALTVFLERFSQNTRVFPGNAAAFVGELHRRWIDRQPAVAVAAPTSDGQSGARGRPDVFVSYSSGDRPAARRLVAALESLGAVVVWFDRHDLGAGDDWRAEILSAIRRCGLFLPLISAGTEGRTEGFFRVEWDEACDRDRAIQGRKFIVPVAIDPAYTGNPSVYQLVPEPFRKYQFAHAPGGEPGEAFRGELVAAIRGLRRVSA